MLPMDLHSKKPFRHRVRLKKWLNVRCLFAYPEEGTVEPRRLHQMPSGEAGSEQGWSVMDPQESIQARSPPSKRKKNPGRL